MILLDVNVLVICHREEDPNHLKTREWLAECWQTGERIAVWDTVLTSAYRVLTNRHFVNHPDVPKRALQFLDVVRNASEIVYPGEGYWEIFAGLVSSSKATGDLVPDVAIAAVAVENKCRVATFDRDFARIRGVDWFRPPI